MTHLIKRYPNRKLYSVEKSHYVTMSQILDMVSSGENIQVINTLDNTDITLKTLKSGLYQLDIGMDQVKLMISNLGRVNGNN
jgi:polyhydroxyalkanoate synthesis regulator protein